MMCGLMKVGNMKGGGDDAACEKRRGGSCF